MISEMAYFSGVKKVVLFIFVVALGLFLSIDADAQCAMCRATAESASHDNEGVGKSLNSGIVYLMLAPYILLATVGIVFFRKKISSLIMGK